ncbi:MAG TPA: TIGR03943 family protein [Crinalium sp.]|jgi:uncharacterized repeat protein (TIGR03943 family)
MLKPFKLFQSLTDRVLKSASAESSITDDSGIDVWRYADPAGEEPDPLKRNLLQWRRLISSVREPLDVFPGESVDLIGFVHRPPNTPDDQFTLARHVIRCCLADTVSLGLVIHTVNAAQFETNTWLHIQGQFTSVPVRNYPTLVIAPSKIKRIPEPQKPYINGVF